MNPTHTHVTQGGRYAMLAHYNSDLSLESQMIVVYRDLDHETETATTAKDWETNWRPIAADDCTVCMGTGTDQIKGNKSNPCGGCYGLGKVRENGETPAGEWQVADVALGIIRRQRQELDRLRQLEALPEVQAVLEKRRARQRGVTAEKEQEWRGGAGHGPRGRRHVGD